MEEYYIEKIDVGVNFIEATITDGKSETEITFIETPIEIIKKVFSNYGIKIEEYAEFEDYEY